MVGKDKSKINVVKMYLGSSPKSRKGQSHNCAETQVKDQDPGKFKVKGWRSGWG